MTRRGRHSKHRLLFPVLLLLLLSARLACRNGRPADDSYVGREMDAPPSEARAPGSSPPRPGPSDEPPKKRETKGSRAECFSALEAKPARVEASLRLGTYNGKWFPDGKPGKNQPDRGGVDLSWLACEWARLDLDLVGVQEFKRGPRAVSATKDWVDELQRVTGGHYETLFDDCPRPWTQHLGFVWNRERVRVARHEVLSAGNPSGEKCGDSLRPTVLVEVTSPHLPPQIARLDVYVVHLKSGADERSFGLRLKGREALFDYARARRRPFVVLGDFNTMGCPGCRKPVSSDEERDAVQREMAQSQGAFLPKPGDSCSTFFDGRAYLLDGFAVSAEAVPLIGSVFSGGYCGALQCSGHGAHLALEKLSDHCPLVLEFPGLPN